MYWKARLESMCGSGAGSDGAASGGAAGGAIDGAALAVAEVPLVQATVSTWTMASSRARQIFNHRGHGGTQGKAWRPFFMVVGRFMVLPVMVFPGMASPVILRVVCG